MMSQPAGTQIKNFVIHLRWHYQVFILSGGYLLGALFIRDIDLLTFTQQFINVHLLLFGGATAYNSYWDKDEGPIGGLKEPPPMNEWMWHASLIIQLLGLIWAYQAGLNFALIYATSMVFFWLYSTPSIRFKAHPILSLVAIGISTGTNSFLMGFLAAGGEFITKPIIITSIGVAFVMLSLYPLSQIYQIEEDKNRGDITFAVRFGIRRVKQFFVISFLAGLLAVAIEVGRIHLKLGWTLGILGVVFGGGLGTFLYHLEGSKDEYRSVMNIKYYLSLLFVLFIFTSVIVLHM